MTTYKQAYLMTVFGLASLVYGFTVYAKEIPQDSIYQLTSQWVDQDGNQRLLSSYSGKKQIISLIYTHCLHTCPTIVTTMQAIEHKLSDKDKKDVGFILVSLTPGTDTPDVMREFAKQRQLNLNHWSLLSGSAEDVRSLAMVLDIKYQKLADNEVNHSNLISLLDKHGRLKFQELGILGSAPIVVEKLAKF